MAQFAPFAHGPYTVELNSVALGLTEGPIRVSQMWHGAPIKCDQYGNSTIDAIQLGADVYIAITLKEWDTAAKGAIYQISGGTAGTVGLIGRALGDIAQSLVLTAVSSTPAATHGPATLTASLAVLAPGQNTELLLGNIERNVPLIFQCLPTASSGLLTHFTST